MTEHANSTAAPVAADGIQIDTTVHEERVTFLEQRLEDFNEQHSPVLHRVRRLPHEGEEPVQVCLLLEDTIVAGISGHTWIDWLHIDLLWVDERYRGAGLGARLIIAAELVARERGCTHSRTETWDFQAPEFYQRQGYRIVGAVPDYPLGSTEYILAKTLE